MNVSSRKFEENSQLEKNMTDTQIIRKCSMYKIKTLPKILLLKVYNIFAFFFFYNSIDESLRKLADKSERIKYNYIYRPKSDPKFD